MNKVIIHTEQGFKLGQSNRYDFNISAYLAEGQTIDSATGIHVPGFGTAANVVIGTIVGGVIPILIGPLSANNEAGPGVKCYVDVDVMLEDPAENPGWRLFFEVPC